MGTFLIKTMKLFNSTILIICLSFGTSMTNAATPYARASISATAAVIPMLGVMSATDQSTEQMKMSALQVINQSNSKMFIQAPKNSALLIHISDANQSDKEKTFLLIKSDTKSNSAADIFSIDLSKIKKTEKSQQTITILTIDN